MGHRHLLGQASATLSPVTGATDDENLGSVKEAIQARGSEQGIQEQIRPFIGGAVAGEENTPPFIAFETSLFILRGSFLLSNNARKKIILLR
jgi:hypothetical protein